MTVPNEFFRRLGLPFRALGIAALLALAACGGGDRVSEFEPRRVIVFGDEASFINTTPPADPTAPGAILVGYRYTVNGFTTTTDSTTTPPTTTTVFDCNVHRIWVQQLAAFAGYGLPGCPREGDTEAPSLNYAVPGARVAGVVAQIDDHLDGDAFTSKDLVTVYVGLHDVIDFYATVTAAADCRFDEENPTGARGPVAQAARVRGEQLAAEILRVANNGSGGRVLFVTVPSVGATPFGRLPNDKAGVERAACLTQLTSAFNSGLRRGIPNGFGRYVGLLELDAQVRAAINPNLGRFANFTTAVCAATAPLPGCTTDTLIDPDGVPTTDTAHAGYLWADELRFGTTMHNILGNLAVSRAFDTNPF